METDTQPAPAAGGRELPAHPPLAVLIFRELDGGAAVTVDELPPGIDANTFCWARELVTRLRSYGADRLVLPRAK